MTNSRTNNIKLSYYEKTQYYNKIEIRKYMNNKYYDVCYHYFYGNHYLLGILFYWETKLWALRRNKFENVHYWYKLKNPLRKNFKLIFYGTVKDIYIISHDKIQRLKNVVHYLNMKIPDILVEIIDLRFCSSLKWDGV